MRMFLNEISRTDTSLIPPAVSEAPPPPAPAGAPVTRPVLCRKRERQRQLNRAVGNHDARIFDPATE
jgi:hypothetical protein